MKTLKMPDTIWARPEHTDDPAYGPWWQTYRDDDTVAQYTRADLTQAAIAAAMQGAAITSGNKIVEIAKIANPDQSVLRLQILRVAMEKAVKASIPSDAMAALAERERQAEQRGRYKALADAANFLTNTYMNMKHIAAQIRAMKGDTP